MSALPATLGILVLVVLAVIVRAALLPTVLVLLVLLATVIGAALLAATLLILVPVCHFSVPSYDRASSVLGTRAEPMGERGCSGGQAIMPANAMKRGVVSQGDGGR